MDDMRTNQLPKDVPYICYEGEMARNERLVKRLIICLAIAVILLFASNVIWLYTWSDYDTVSYDQDGAGINNINAGSQGDVLNDPKAEGAN